jgi:signal peptidase I
MMVRRTARLLAWTAVILVALLGLARMFLFRTYYVEGRSMEPTIHGALEGGDRLLVAYGGANDLERFDLVLVLPGGKGEPKIKRVAGLPGDAVAIRDGNLWINRALLPPEARRPDPVLLFDEQVDSLERRFSTNEHWTRGEEGWALDASNVDEGARAGCMHLVLALRDHYRGPDGELVFGEIAVRDAILECEFRFEDPPARLRLGLLERGDTFEAVIEPPEEGNSAVYLFRRNSSRSGSDATEPVAQGRLALSSGFHQARFSNVDNCIVLEIDGRAEIEYGYEKNDRHGLDDPGHGRERLTQRIYLGGEQGRATFRGIRVLRDLHYTRLHDLPDGGYGADLELQLGPNQIFVLGDNSRISEDGRRWGPTPLGEVIGRPLAIIWPPHRARVLGGGDSE